MEVSYAHSKSQLHLPSNTQIASNYRSKIVLSFVNCTVVDLSPACANPLTLSTDRRLICSLGSTITLNGIEQSVHIRSCDTLETPVYFYPDADS